MQSASGCWSRLFLQFQFLFVFALAVLHSGSYSGCQLLLCSFLLSHCMLLLAICFSCCTFVAKSGLVLLCFARFLSFLIHLCIAFWVFVFFFVSCFCVSQWSQTHRQAGKLFNLAVEHGVPECS